MNRAGVVVTVALAQHGNGDSLSTLVKQTTAFTVMTQKKRNNLPHVQFKHVKLQLSFLEYTSGKLLYLRPRIRNLLLPLC